MVSAFAGINDASCFNSRFTSAPNSYCVYYTPESKVYEAGNELYNRDSCTSCCRVIFASDYDYVTGQRFTDQDDINNHTRFVMDMEFDDKSSVRKATGSYEQCILVRPLKTGNELQFFEFAPYKMYTSYSIPKRVHDIRGGSAIGSRLIIWQKKPPLDAGTNNQRFVYVFPYNDYPQTQSYKWRDYKYHFYLPYYTGGHLCYEVLGTDSRSTWSGNKNLQVIGESYQIKAQTCNKDEPKQIFIPVFA